MARITPPKYVRQVLLGLQAREYRAYLVGGCVRDMIIGITPNDWDICTSALPKEVMEIFPTSRPTGLKHGTVTVVIGSHSVEVTTFRADGAYSDHRRPDSISFVTDLTADLSRRDFTMNAVALSPDGLTVDPFGGIEDIRLGIVRCVGEPELRFEELISTPILPLLRKRPLQRLSRRNVCGMNLKKRCSPTTLNASVR